MQSVVPNAAELAGLLVPTRFGSRTVGELGPVDRAPAVQVNLGSKLR